MLRVTPCLTMDVRCHSVNDSVCRSVVLDDPSVFKTATIALICALVTNSCD